MPVEQSTEQFKSLVKDGLTVLWSINGEEPSDQLKNFIEEHKNQLNRNEWKEILSTLSNPDLVAIVTSALGQEQSNPSKNDPSIPIEYGKLERSQAELAVPNLDEIFKKIKDDELLVEDRQVVESFKKWARIFQSKVFTLCQFEHVDPYDVDWWHVYINNRTIGTPMKRYLEDLAKSLQGDLDLGLSVLSQIPDEALNKFVSDRFWQYCDDFHKELRRQRENSDSGDGFLIGFFSLLFILGLWWIIFKLGFFG